MKIRAILFILLFVSNISVIFAQSIFSVEKVDKEDFMQAKSSSEKFNLQSQKIDSVALSGVLSIVFQNAKERISELDYEALSYLFEEKTEDQLFHVDNMLYYPTLGILGIMVTPGYDSNIVWWYNSANGQPVGITDYPQAVNKNGFLVYQVFQDCNTCLDLHFYEKYVYNRREIYLCENQVYMSKEFSPCEELIPFVFWHKDTTLFVHAIDWKSGPETQAVYLKITLN